MILRMKSLITGNTSEMELPVTPTEIENWRTGKLPIQVALPALDADQREFVMTGITREEWDNAFEK